MLIASGPERAIVAPADGTVVGSVHESVVEDVETAIRAATDGQRAWSRAAPHARAAVLTRAAEAMRDRAGDLAVLHATESGKVIGQARREVLGAASLLDENAHLAKFEAGYLAPTGALGGGEQDLTIIERVPLGTVACVIPFNFPVELTIEKAGAALAAGNAVILKPPPQNPLASLGTAQALWDAGLPAGVLSVLTGGREVSAALCAAPGIDAVSLTGSVGAGIAVAQATASMLRPLHLELGGNGAAVVMEDADLELVVSETLRGRLLMNGQACAATKRLIVHRSVLGEVIARLEEALSRVVMGDPTDEASEVGPLIDATSADRVAGQVSRAVSQGGSIVMGQAAAREAWFGPTLVTDVPPEADVAADDEIFGPVVTVIPFDDDEQAVRIVNGSQLALTAAVFSADLSRCMAAAQQFEVGGVVVNGTNNYRPPVVPFGGVGLAGTGREGIGYTYEEMTRTRFIAIRGLRPAAVPIGGDR